MCNIGKAFENCTIQVSNALPNLTEINIHYCNDMEELPIGLCDIVHLKKLSITNCHKLFALLEEIGKLVNLEVLRLSSCVGKFRPWLIELTSFKPKLLIRFIMNKPC